MNLLSGTDALGATLASAMNLAFPVVSNSTRLPGIWFKAAYTLSNVLAGLGFINGLSECGIRRTSPLQTDCAKVKSALLSSHISPIRHRTLTLRSHCTRSERVAVADASASSSRLETGEWPSREMYCEQVYPTVVRRRWTSHTAGRLGVTWSGESTSSPSDCPTLPFDHPGVRRLQLSDQCSSTGSSTGRSTGKNS